MSPEQVKGKAVDRRTDIWAFGCVLFELLAGKRAFEGETVSEMTAAILRGEPDWAALPETMPAEFRRLLARCLRKETRSRLQSMGDARIALEEQMAKRDDGERSPRAEVVIRVRWQQIVSWIVPGLLAGAALMWGWTSLRLLRFEPPPVQRLMVAGVYSGLTSPAAISPDGQLIAFTKDEPAARTSGIYIRRMDSFESNLIPGTESGRSPFFSPDSRWIAYVGDQGLMKIPVDGGAPQFICSAASDSEGAWGPDGTIVLSYGVLDGRTWQGLLRVPVAGGRPGVLTTPDPHKKERVHSVPVFLPDRDVVLFTVRTDTDYRIDAVSLHTGARSHILEGASAPRYSPTGHLLYQAHAGKTI